MVEELEEERPRGCLVVRNNYRPEGSEKGNVCAGVKVISAMQEVRRGTSVLG